MSCDNPTFWNCCQSTIGSLLFPTLKDCKTLTWFCFWDRGLYINRTEAPDRQVYICWINICTIFHWTTRSCTFLTQQPRICSVLKLHFLFQNLIAHGSLFSLEFLAVYIFSLWIKGICVKPTFKAVISKSYGHFSAVFCLERNLVLVI